MKKLLISAFIFITLLSFPIPALSTNYAKDLIITGPDAIWTDSRAYSTLNAAVTAVGANVRTIVITEPEVVTALTIPANITLDFRRNGSITNSGQLTFSGQNIIAPGRQIFTGAGDIDFADGSSVQSSWFADIHEAIDVTSDDTLELVISKAENLDTSVAVGANVTLKWEIPGNVITIDNAVTLSDINYIKAGKYQIFIYIGTGDTDFVTGSEIKSSWFADLTAALVLINDDTVTLTIDATAALTADTTVPIGNRLRILKGLPISVSTGNTLTIGSMDMSGFYRKFTLAGTANVIFSAGAVEYVEDIWFGTVRDLATSDSVPLQKAIDSAQDSNLFLHLVEGATYFIDVGLTMKHGKGAADSMSYNARLRGNNAVIKPTTAIVALSIVPRCLFADVATGRAIADINISDLTFGGSEEPTATAMEVGVTNYRIDNFSYSHITNITVQGFTSSGVVDVVEARHIIWDDLVIRAGGLYIHADTADTFVGDMIFRDFESTGTETIPPLYMYIPAGIKSFVAGFHFTDPVIYGSGTYLYNAGIADGQIKDIWFSNAAWDGPDAPAGEYAVKIYADGAGDIFGIRFIDIYMVNYTGYGIHVEGVGTSDIKGIEIIGGDMTLLTDVPIYVKIVNGVRISGMRFALITAGEFIYFNEAINLLVDGNIGISTTVTDGIEIVDGGGLSDFYSFTDNVFNVSGSVVLNTAAGATAQVTDNLKI